MDSSKFFEFSFPTRIWCGSNAIERLGEVVKTFVTEDVFLVTDKGLTKSGLLDKVLGVLRQSKIACEVFDDVEPNPDVQTVNRGAELFAKRIDRPIIAFGGGSPIDAAKAIGVKATHDGDIRDYTRHGSKVVQSVTPPIIAVPTTAGTGSEVTWVSVLVDQRSNRKIVVPSPYIAPKLAIIDPLMTRSLPPSVTATTGMDALTHAVEAYVSLKSGPMADAFALRAIETISRSLREAVGNGGNMEARTDMLLASTMAGVAFINGGLGLVHSVAHALGGRYNIAHGLANAIMLPIVMNFNLGAAPSRYRDIAAAMGETVSDLGLREAARKSVTAVEDLSTDIGIPQGLGALGIQDLSIDKLVEDALDDKGTFPFNPRPPTGSDVVKILEEALKK